MTQGAFPPGWYPDQSDPSYERYWDGGGWRATRPAQRSWPQPPPPRKRRRWPVMLAVIIVLVIGGAAAVLLAWKPWSSSTSTFTVTGTFALHGTPDLGDGEGQILVTDSDSTCAGENGYDDIQDGVEVTISDSSGKTLALGDLEGSTYEATHHTCRFDIVVDGVPSGRDFYRVEVSHRGEQQYTQADLEAGIALTLGS